MKKLLLVFLLVLFLPIAAAQEIPQKKEKKDSRKEILNQVESFKKSVSGIRGKKFRKDFGVGIKTKGELEKYILAQTEKPEFVEEMDKAKKVLVKLGLIEPKLDLTKIMVDMLTEQVAGFYDPEKSELFLMEQNIGTPMQDMVLAHEIFHALQDQYYHIDAMMQVIHHNDDLGLALKSIIEGEATLGGLEYMFAKNGSSVLNMPVDIGKMLYEQAKLGQQANPNSALAKAPKFIQEMLFFSYGYGSSFVQQYLAKHSSWKTLDNLFENPPLSTEQIMHPDKYIKQIDYPVKIHLPLLHERLKGEWKEVITSNMGEFQTRIMLAEFIDEETSEKAARGWDGDAYILIESAEKEGASIFGWLSVWDTEKDAEEFAKACAGMFEKRFGANALKTENGYALKDKNSDETAFIEYAGTEVLVILGAPDSILAQVRAELLKSRQVIVKEAKFGALSENKTSIPRQGDEEEKEESPARDF